MSLTFHPLAELFPLMEGEEFDALVADIKANGLCEPITLLDGKILDGRNRYRACLAAGVEPDIIKGDGAIDDPAAYVISANIRRRHLSAEQRRDLIAKLMKAQPEKSNRQIAKTVKVDDKTVGSVRRELEGRAEIPHVDQRTDSKGRKQPARKAKTETVLATSIGPDNAPDPETGAAIRKALFATMEEGEPETETDTEAKGKPETDTVEENKPETNTWEEDDPDDERTIRVEIMVSPRMIWEIDKYVEWRQSRSSENDITRERIIEKQIRDWCDGQLRSSRKARERAEQAQQRRQERRERKAQTEPQQIDLEECIAKCDRREAEQQGA
jgi:hypothetical protein